MAELANEDMRFEVNSHAEMSAEMGEQRSIAVTIEHALYFSIFALGAAVRFWDLTRVPLTALEARNSWAAWQDAMAQQLVALTPTSPLFLNLQRLLFWLGADGDAAARLVSALAGSLLVLVAWPLRGILGRPTALVLAFLLAIDPWLVALSRFADGAMLSLMLSMALLATFVLLVQSDAARTDKRLRILSSIAALLTGLLLTSGHMAWSLLPVLAVFALMNFTRLRQMFVADRVSLLWLGGGFLAGGTGWLLRLHDFGLVSDSLTMWSNSVLTAGAPVLTNSAATRYSANWVIGRLVVDQPFVLLFGLGGLIHMTWRRDLPEYAKLRWTTLLWFWLAWGAVLCVLPGRSPFSLVVIVMPMLLAAAYAVGRLCGAISLTDKWRELFLVSAVLVILLVSGLFWAIALVANRALDMLMLQAVLLTLLLVLSVLVFTGIWAGWRESFLIAIVVGGAALLYIDVGAMWRASHWYEQGRPAGLFTQNSDLDVRRLAADVEKFSAQRIGDASQAPVLIERFDRRAGDGDSGQAGLSEDAAVVLGWYLRNMSQVQFGDSGEMIRGENYVVITSENMDTALALTGGEDFTGRRYRIAWKHADDNALEATIADEAAPGGIRLTIDDFWFDKIQPWLRWALYRIESEPLQTEDVILWAPADR